MLRAASELWHHRLPGYSAIYTDEPFECHCGQNTTQALTSPFTPPPASSIPTVLLLFLSLVQL